MGFSLTSLEHSIAALASKIKTGFLAVEKFVTKNGGTITKDLEIITGIAAFIPGLGPTAMVIERAGEASLGIIINAIHKLHADVDKAEGDTVQITLAIKKDLVADYQALSAALKGALSNSMAGTLQVHEQLPASAPAPAIAQASNQAPQSLSAIMAQQAAPAGATYQGPFSGAVTKQG